ncbi:MAG: dihydrolipoamide acetyltransferase family protein [Chloroflexota bacterium]
MITEVVMPAMGADMTEGTIVKWLKSEGDDVKRGDTLAEIETDKTVVEMEAFGSGQLRKIIVSEGQRVPVGEIIGYIGDPDDELPASAGGDGGSGQAAQEQPAAEQETAGEAQPEEQQAEPKQETPSAPAAEAPEPAPAQAATEDGRGRVKASPIARRLAKERGIDLSQVQGTGPGGRIVKADIESFEGAPAAAEAPSGQAAAAAPGQQVQLSGEDIPLSNMRQAIARVTVRSKTEHPHYYINMTVDMTEAMRLRQQLNEEVGEEGPRISVNDMIIRASVKALIKYPKFNSFFDGDKLKGHSDINIGIAISLDQGLIVPAILGCQNRTLPQIAAATKNLAERVRGRGQPLTQEENTGATFSISNMGMFGVDSFTAIIVPPQAAILAVGSVAKTPVVRDGEVVARDTMVLTLSADHRVSDGAEGALFVGEIKRLLENPVGLLL